MTVQVDQSHLRSIIREVKHGLTGKESPHANPVHTTDQPPFLPTFHTVGMSGLSQLFIRLHELR